MTIWHKRIACWIPKTKNTHAKYAIIIAIPLKKIAARKQLSVALQARCEPC